MQSATQYSLKVVDLRSPAITEVLIASNLKVIHLKYAKKISPTRCLAMRGWGQNVCFFTKHILDHLERSNSMLIFILAIYFFFCFIGRVKSSLFNDYWQRRSLWMILFHPWLYGTAKPKRLEMVLLVIKWTMLHKFRAF